MLITIFPPQNGRTAKSEIHIAKRRLHLLAWLKRPIFFSYLGKNIKAIFLLPSARKLVQVPLLLLWFRTCTTNIHKIVKGVNDNLTQDKHQNYYLVGHAIGHSLDWSLLDDRSLFRRDTLEPRHSNLPSATSRICSKLEKSVLTLGQEIGFLGMKISSVTLELSLKERK